MSDGKGSGGPQSNEQNSAGHDGDGQQQTPPNQTGVVGSAGKSGPGFEASQRGGHPERRFSVAVSVGAMALAWARQEGAPEGATVVAEREVSPLGRLGELWRVPAAVTLAAAVVLRPALPVHLADAVWLVAGLASAEGAEAASGRQLGVMWPDAVVDVATDQVVGSVKSEIQLGPGRVGSAVLSLRLDLQALGLGRAGRDSLLDEVLVAMDRGAEWLREGADGCALAAAAYSQRCTLLGRRVKVILMPRGEARGVVQRVDPSARLEVVSATGMVERVGVDMLRRLEMVDESP